MSDDTRAMSDFTLDGLHKALMKERDFLYRENARLREALENLRNNYSFANGQVYNDIEKALKGSEE